MTKAAKSLNLTQGAVTLQIQHFERALQLLLFERSARGIHLTEAGNAIRGACTLVSRDLETITDIARQYVTLETGQLRIGADRTCGSSYLPRYLSAFCQRSPDLDLRISIGIGDTIAELVINGTLDCGLVATPVADARLETYNVCEDELVAVVGKDHPLANIADPDAATLALHRHLTRDHRGTAQDMAYAMLGEASAAHTVNFGDFDAMKAAVLEGLGFAVLPKVCVMRELEDGALIRLPHKPAVRWVVAMRRKASQIPAVNAFWQMLLNDDAV
jgi:DNA-binding transcriptional LysR family regulator